MPEESRRALFDQHLGKHEDCLVVGSRAADIYRKHDDLRYGTNPDQSAALYRPAFGPPTFLTSLDELRRGKKKMSQTNFEDIVYAALSARPFSVPSVAVMKHENPSGFAVQYRPEPLAQTVRKARDTDFRAAFGGTYFLNRSVDQDTAAALQEELAEVLVAPDFDEGVIGGFKGNIRILKYDTAAFERIPVFTGDPAVTEIRRLPDGTVIESDVYLTPIRTSSELQQYVASNRQPTPQELEDMHTGYRIRVRSNSIRLVKNDVAVGIGTGQQDRVMCLDTAAYKNRQLAKLAESLGRSRAADYSTKGSALVSDGFFPFPDSIELAHELGVTAVLAPHGGERFNDVRAKINEYGMAFVDLPDNLRFFDHH